MTNAELTQKLQSTQAYFFAFLSSPAQATYVINVTARSAGATLTVTQADANMLRAENHHAHFIFVFNWLVEHLSPSRQRNGVTLVP